MDSFINVESMFKSVVMFQIKTFFVHIKRARLLCQDNPSIYSVFISIYSSSCALEVLRTSGDGATRLHPHVRAW